MVRRTQGSSRHRVYAFVRERVQAGMPPTIREVQEHLGFRAVQSARQHLEALVADAVQAHVGDFPNLGDDELKAARKRFWELRDSPLDKKPSTAELLVWLCILSARGITAADLRDRPLRALPAIEALVKDKDDLEVLG